MVPVSLRPKLGARRQGSVRWPGAVRDVLQAKSQLQHTFDLYKLRGTCIGLYRTMTIISNTLQRICDYRKTLVRFHCFPPAEIWSWFGCLGTLWFQWLLSWLWQTHRCMVIGPRIGGSGPDHVDAKVWVVTVDRTSLEEEAPVSQSNADAARVYRLNCVRQNHTDGHDMVMIMLLRPRNISFIFRMMMYNIPFDVVYKACTMLWHGDAWWQSVINHLLMQSCLIDVTDCNMM